MKHLLLGLLCFLGSCASSPIAARVSSSGAVEIGFDFENVVILSRGQGYAILYSTEVGIPFFARAFDENKVYVAHLTDPRVSATIDLGAPIPAEYEPIFRALFRDDELEQLGIVFIEG